MLRLVVLLLRAEAGDLVRERRNLYFCNPGNLEVRVHSGVWYIEDKRTVAILWRVSRCEPETFLKAVELYRDDLVVGVECIFTWYWLADLCAREDISFVLGHALYMKAIHGGKAKNDRIDSQKIAILLRGGMLPQAYVYPAGMRSTRDLLRRRLYMVRRRGKLLAHIQNTSSCAAIPRGLACSTRACASTARARRSASWPTSVA